MKKILLVFNGEIYNARLAGFGIRLAQQIGAPLQGVFTSPFVEQMSTYPFPGELPSLAKEITGVKELNEQHHKLIKANIDLFVEDCKKSNVEFHTTADNDIRVNELIDLSAFSDLILCDAKEYYGSYSFKDFVGDVHCPVILVSEYARLPQRLIICYDESFSSVNAVRKFCSLFPNWKRLPVSVVSINPKGDNGGKIDEYLDEWLNEQFSTIERVHLEGNLQKELTNYVGTASSDSLVIMGNYEGNAMSRIFHKSLANVILHETSANLFLSHD